MILLKLTLTACQQETFGDEGTHYTQLICRLRRVDQRFSSVVPSPGALASSGNLLEKQIPKPRPRPDPETLSQGAGPNSGVNKASE